MGGLTTALGPILQIGSALGTAVSAVAPFYQDSQRNKQAAEKSKLDYQQALAAANLQKQQQALQDQKDETTRRDLLRRSMAKQRAEFGSSGIGSGGGSSEAVLLGMFDESDAQRALREQMSSLRDAALDQSVNDKNQLNLLLQQQLQQSQNIGQIARIAKGGLLSD